jgi:hypothetical protein
MVRVESPTKNLVAFRVEQRKMFVASANRFKLLVEALKLLQFEWNLSDVVLEFAFEAFDLRVEGENVLASIEDATGV